MPATITGLIKHPTGLVRAVEVLFYPLSTPMVEGAVLITTSEPKVATSLVDGTFSIVLEQGDYRVVIGEDAVQIAVPNDEATHQFVDLLSEALTYVYPAPHPNQYPIATATVSGGVKTNTTVADPVVYRKQEVDSLIAALTDRYLEHIQSSANAVWAVVHNWGRRPTVDLVQDDGAVMEADIFHLNTNSLEVRFGAAKTGRAILRA